MKNRLMCLALIAALTGCANPYADYYRGMADVTSNPRFVKSSSPVSVYQVGNLDKEVLALRKRGFVVVGVSSFSGGGKGATDTNLKAVGEKVGASIVVLNTAYIGSKTSSIPITTPTSTTSFSTANATAYGAGGVVNAYGTGTTTTYGTSTNYIPMTVDQHSYMAVYMAKFTFKVGLVLDPLTDADRQVIESNAGARVSIVVDGTPAFDADILPGDILLSIADRKLSGVNSLVEITDPMPAGPVPFKLWRNGQAIVKSVLLR